MELNFDLSLRENSRIHKVHEYHILYEYAKFDTSIVFRRSELVEFRKSVYRNLIKDSQSRILVIRNYLKSRHCRPINNSFRSPVVRYAISRDPKLRQEIVKMLETHTTVTLAEFLGVDDRSLRSILKDNKISYNSSRRISKAHLRYKVIIEKLLGIKFITEYGIPYLNRRIYVDEYSPELNLCIEIDGAWCHDLEWDKERDNFLNSQGFKVLRIPYNKFCDDEESYVKSFLFP